jgi:hypothetical protein
VIWSPQTGPICAYEDPVLAHEHAKTMLGVQVASVELRSELPAIARDDLVSKFNDQFEGDSTPVDEIPIDAIDDAIDVIDKIVVDPEE